MKPGGRTFQANKATLKPCYKVSNRLHIGLVTCMPMPRRGRDAGIDSWSSEAGSRTEGNMVRSVRL